MDQGCEIVEEEGINNLLLGIMEGYSGSAIPPLSIFSPCSKNHNHFEGFNLKKRSRPRNGEREEEEEEDFVTQSRKKERENREKMKKSYDVLQSMVPNLFPKSTNEQIVTKTIEHIRNLKKEIRILELLKLSSNSVAAEDKMSTTQNSSSIEVAVSGNVTFFGIRSEVRQSLVPKIFMVFHEYGAEVLAANIAVNHGQLTLSVTAIVAGNYIIENIRRDILVL
ncbi:transcription factor bHLH13-like [Tripterygium wilfordii]|uniref:transcription factor bHLH13-like n=1 Tax=Tripterygium wilfordii TaxID=458696 RepID=UPI0018F8267E|nr:transcription factor bHLH13-like [Tripterygium wilfordii]